MSSGWSRAALFMLTLSAPAFSSISTSANSLIPPPTVNGMLISAATRETMSANVFLPSTLAVISKKTSSSAPSSLYSLPSSTGSPALLRLLKLVPFTVSPFLTSRQGMIRFANLLIGLIVECRFYLRRMLCQKRRRELLPLRVFQNHCYKKFHH